MYNREPGHRTGASRSAGIDTRVTAVLAERFVSFLNPYTYTGLENLPDSPPYIIAANHDVLRGAYTNMPYDGVLLNHWLKEVRGLSPYWMAKLSSDSALNKLGEASKCVPPLVRIGFKSLFDMTGQAVYVSPDKCKEPLQELASKLQQGEVVCLFPTGSKYSQRVKAGVLYLSQKGGSEDSAVPIVPVRISRTEEGILRSSYNLEVKMPIHPTFETGRLSRDEIRMYTAQIQQSLYG